MDIDKIKKELGLRIRSYRIQNRMTQEQFCALTEIEQANLSNIENGKTYPGFSTLCTIIEKGHIDPNYLFEFLSDKNSKQKSTDYEILNMIMNLPEESKQVIKNLIKLIKK